MLNLNKIGAKIKNHNFIELYKQNEKKKSRIIQNFDSLKTNSLPMFVYTHNQKKKKNIYRISISWTPLKMHSKQKQIPISISIIQIILYQIFELET